MSSEVKTAAASPEHAAPAAVGPGAAAAVILAHFTVDFYAGYTAPLLRYFHEHFGLSQMQTSLLTIPNSLTVLFQPLLGLASDRMRTRLFVVGGLILGVAGYGLVFPLAAMAGPGAGYLLALVGIWAGAIGLACYHPQGAAIAGRSRSGRFGGAVAIFVFSGSLGYGLGILMPPLFIPGRIPWIALLAALGLVALAAQRAVPRLRPEGEALALPSVRSTLRQLAGDLRPHLGLLSLFWMLVVLRAATLIGFQQFTSIHYGGEHAFSDARGAVLVAAFFLVQALAGLGGTAVAERFGVRRVLGLSFALGGALLLGALDLSSAGCVWASCALLVAGGAVLGLSIPINVAAGQRLLPRSAALASGIMLGFGWGVGGMLVPLLAGLGDLFGGTWTVLAASAALCVPAAGLVLLLPRDEAASVVGKKP
ncbi:MAG TPA: MFS transporter [Planctomycetota bacterium]|nr:MFS transporter [Planctomycetota bacterium]